MIYDYSYMAVADGKTGELLWTFNSSQGLMSSTLTLLNKRRGYDGTLFVSMGKSKEQLQTGEMVTDQHHEEKRDVCAREYVEDERKMCAAARSEKAARQKRQDNGDPSNSELYRQMLFRQCTCVTAFNNESKFSFKMSVCEKFSL